MNCPICKKDVTDSFRVWTDNPFVAHEALPGLAAWGGLGVQRTVLCQNARFVHFKFDRIGKEHLVEMVPNLAEVRAIIRDHYLHQSQLCEHEGCTKLGVPGWTLFGEEEPVGWYCDEHSFEHGFCPMCHTFCAGLEDFDFSPHEMCGECWEQIEAEFSDDFDDEVDDYDDYDREYLP